MLTKKILRTTKRYEMVRPGDRVLVGLSGGPDSVALTDVLVELRDALGIELVAAHLNHQLRPESDDDEAFCRALAEKLNLPFVASRTDVARLAATNKRSVEDEARRTRYRFLLERAALDGCRTVAVGHTMDDQAETFLMRLARGSGPRGLSSAYPVVKKGDIDIVRPLIEVRRDELLARLEARGLGYRNDLSNLDRRFTRNRVRHDVLPFVASQLNENLVETLANSAEILRDEEAFLDAAARRHYLGTATAGETRVAISVAALGEMSLAIRRRVIRMAIEHVRGDTANVTFGHVGDVLSLLDAGKSGRAIHLPRVVAERSFDELVFAAPSHRGEVVNGYNRFDYRLTIPAELRIEECRGLLTAHLVESVRVGDEPGAAAGNAVVVGVEDGLSELRVRSPKPSD